MTEEFDPSTTEEYELLTAKQKERSGTVETATVQRVRVSRTQVSLSLSFDWTAETTRIVYDLDDDRDVSKLESLVAEHGFEFVQIGHLEGLPVTVQYTSRGWVPTVHLAYTDGEGSLPETVRTELELFGRKLVRTPGFLRGVVTWTRSLTTKQFIVGVIIVKKLLLIAILVALVL